MDGSSAWPKSQQGCSAYSILLGVLITANKCAKIVRSHAKVWLVKVIETIIQSHSGLNYTLGGIASIFFRFHFQQTLRIQIQRS